MDDVQTQSHARTAAPAHLDDDPPRRRWIVVGVLVPVVLIVLLVIAWAVDSGAGEVSRNVRLAGVDIGGLTEEQLTGRVGEVASDFGSTPVALLVGEATYETTAADLGLAVDEELTAASALEVGESSFLPARPFAWAASLFSERQAPLQLRIDAETAAAKLVELEADNRILPTEPTVELVEGTFRVVAGQDGTGIDAAEVVRRLPGEAEGAMAERDEIIRLVIDQTPIPPLGTREAAEQAAADAEALVSEPIEIRTAGGARTIESDELRSWARVANNPDGSLVVTFDQAEVDTSLRQAFADVEGRPVDASITLDGGVPVIRADQPGKVCCGPGTAPAVLRTLQGGSRAVDLALVDGPASFTTADAEAYGIREAVGGNNAWRNGAPTTAGPGFTTYHAAGGNRVANIHRIADLVRGVVIAPGASFSVNDHVGRRTAENGFLPAGAIRDGEHVDEIGGGISQFATTTFNAAYFAGLQIDASQAHSEYFDRYPRGREATMGFPAPDLAFTNDTPYGILIWTSYTNTSLTVTLYSTPHGRAEQTAIRESTSGRCRVVATTRTITYPDGTTASDEFRATYRPGEGQGC